MQSGCVESPPRFRAFLSYSHIDSAFAAALHRWLESFHIPKPLVGQEAPGGAVPARLHPIFRDRDELPAAADLSAEVRSALAQSQTLIVLCSQAAAESHWVRREILAFRELAPERPVLAALVPGAPPGCISALFESSGVEPVAADFNSAGDGRRFGLLKLVAGMTGLPFDALVRRDSQRRLRRVIAVTLLALAGMLLFAAIAAAAIDAKRTASRERDRAEALVEFMLTDLRERLRGVGRLDVLGAVNDRVLAHYSGQDLDELPPDAIERRARMLHAMGEDEDKKGRLDRAVPKWLEAHRATEALLARDQNDPDRIFGHAQSEFWLGYAAFAGGKIEAARPRFEAYKKLADRLVRTDPANADYRKESAYAEGNLCSLILAAKPLDGKRAVASCRASLDQMQAAAERTPPQEQASVQAAVGNRHAWLADALLKTGDGRGAATHYRAQEQIVERLLAADPLNLEHRDTWVVTQFSLAQIDAESGERAGARKRLERAARVIARMRAFDRANAVWSDRARRVEDDLRKLSGGEAK